MLDGYFNTNARRGWLAVAGCLMLDISVGEFNLLSYLYPYFSSYFHSKDESVTPKSMILLPAVWLFVQVITGPLAIKIYNMFGFRITFFIFLCWFYIGQLVSSLITNFYLFAVVYGFFGGGAQGALIILPLYCCWRFFPENKKGLVSGIVLSAYALAPIGTSIIALWIVNPNNESPIKSGNFKYFGEEVYKNVPKFFRIFGTFCFCLGGCGILLIMDPLQKEKEMSDSEFEIEMTKPRINVMLTDSPVPRRASVRMALETNKDKNLIKEMSWEDVKYFFSDRNFLMMYGIVFIGFLFPNLMHFTFKQVGLERLVQPDRFIMLMGGFSELFNAGSRLAAGLLFQSKGFKFCCFILIFINVTCAFTFMPLSWYKPTFGISLCYYFTAYGGQLGLYPLVAYTLFRSQGALAYSLLFSGFSMSFIALSFTHGILTKWVGLDNVFYILGVLSVIPIYWVFQIDHVLQIRKDAQRDDLMEKLDEDHKSLNFYGIKDES